MEINERLAEKLRDIRGSLMSVGGMGGSFEEKREFLHQVAALVNGMEQDVIRGLIALDQPTERLAKHVSDALEAAKEIVAIRTASFSGAVRLGDMAYMNPGPDDWLRGLRSLNDEVAKLRERVVNYAPDVVSGVAALGEVEGR